MNWTFYTCTEHQYRACTKICTQSFVFFELFEDRGIHNLPLHVQSCPFGNFIPKKDYFGVLKPFEDLEIVPKVFWGSGNTSILKYYYSSDSAFFKGIFCVFFKSFIWGFFLEMQSLRLGDVPPFLDIIFVMPNCRN